MIGAGNPAKAALTALLSDRGACWSVGTPRAVLGFSPSGPWHEQGQGLCAVTGGSRLLLKPDARLLAFETISADPLAWGQGIALLVPDPGVVPPVSAIRYNDDGSLDLGLGDGVVRALFHPAKSGDTAGLAGRLHADAREALNGMAGCWIVETEVATISRTSAGGTSLLHSMPDLTIRHPPSTPVHASFVPAAHVFPRHPLRAAGFDHDTHDAFQTLLRQFGRPDLWQVKQSLRVALERGQADIPRPRIVGGDRHIRATVRVTLRQWWHETGRLPPRDWLREWDPPFYRALTSSGTISDT